MEGETMKSPLCDTRVISQTTWSKTQPSSWEQKMAFILQQRPQQCSEQPWFCSIPSLCTPVCWNLLRTFPCPSSGTQALDWMALGWHRLTGLRTRFWTVTGTCWEKQVGFWQFSSSCLHSSGHAQTELMEFPLPAKGSMKQIILCPKYTVEPWGTSN